MSNFVSYLLQYNTLSAVLIFQPQGSIALMKWLALVLITFAAWCPATRSADPCPDLPSLRTDYVVNNFDPSKAEGFWYEIAYQDLAQIGETCQAYNKTRIDSGISEQFLFTYKSPRKMELMYEKTEDTAVYSRYMTAIESLRFPSVVVDVTAGQGDEPYSTITEYLCSPEGGVRYEEIRIGSRTKTLSPNELSTIIQVLKNAGIDSSQLKMVDQAGCEYYAPPK